MRVDLLLRETRLRQIREVHVERKSLNISVIVITVAVWRYAKIKLWIEFIIGAHSSSRMA
jgi:hypothetical protein